MSSQTSIQIYRVIVLILGIVPLVIGVILDLVCMWFKDTRSPDPGEFFYVWWFNWLHDAKECHYAGKFEKTLRKNNLKNKHKPDSNKSHPGHGACLDCERAFTIHNPHAGGGVCQSCWATSH